MFANIWEVKGKNKPENTRFWAHFKTNQKYTTTPDWKIVGNGFQKKPVCETWLKNTPPGSPDLNSSVLLVQPSNMSGGQSNTLNPWS